MSSTNLEDLSNDEIRLRLLEYGFANLPVTQTTRKVLVKKLKNAMETQKTKNRRETVAIIKSSDDEDIPEANKKRERTPNRRATIAVTEKTKKVPASSSSNESIPRSETPIKANSRRSSRATPAKEKPVVSSSGNIINEESDDDVVEVRTYTRRSKTPTTISKSETVRTSYKNETATEPVVEKKRYPDPIIEPIVTKTTATRRKTYTVETEHFDVPPRTETPTKFGKSSLTTSFNPSGNYRFEKEQDIDLNLDEKETPYLSNFAKRLSTLKAEPLNASYSKQSYTDVKSHDDYGYSSRYSTQYGSSYQPAVKRQGIVNQMAKDFNSMDRKYSIRKYAFIAVLIMLIIFIYVLLFM